AAQLSRERRTAAAAASRVLPSGRAQGPFVGKHHVGALQSEFVSSCEEQPAIRVEDEFVRRSAERKGERHDGALAAFDLDERTDRRFIEGDGGVLGREFLSEL